MVMNPCCSHQYCCEQPRLAACFPSETGGEQRRAANISQGPGVLLRGRARQRVDLVLQVGAVTDQIFSHHLELLLEEKS